MCPVERSDTGYFDLAPILVDLVSSPSTLPAWWRRWVRQADDDVRSDGDIGYLQGLVLGPEPGDPLLDELSNFGERCSITSVGHKGES